MHIKTIVTALAVASLMTGSAYAQHTTTLTGSIFDGPYKDGPRTFENEAHKGGEGGPTVLMLEANPGLPPVEVVVPPVTEVPPVVVEPEAPVEPEEPVEPEVPGEEEPPVEEPCNCVPATPLEPSTPQEGVLEIQLPGGDIETVRNAVGAGENGEFNFTLGDSYTLSDGTVINPGTYSGRIDPNGKVVYRYTPPVVTEVPSTPLPPATPNPGVFRGNITGTPYASFIPAAGQPVYDQPIEVPAGVVFNGQAIPQGSYRLIVAPNGMFVLGPRIAY